MLLICFGFVIWMACPQSINFFFNFFFLSLFPRHNRWARINFLSIYKYKHIGLSHTRKRPLNCRVNIVRFFEELKKIIHTYTSKINNKFVCRVHLINESIKISTTQWSRQTFVIWCKSTYSSAPNKSLKHSKSFDRLKLNSTSKR